MAAVAATTGLVLMLVTGAPAIANGGSGPLDGLDYVSLGDSYQAGYGLNPFSNTSPFAGDPNGCYQADGNYPHILAAYFGLTINDQTCSGAITANIGYGSATVSPTDPNVILPTLPDVSTLQVTLSGMTAPQLQSAGLSADTDVVTVGIGGNDLGFSSIATACMRLTVDSDPLYLADKVGAFDNCKDYFDDPVNYPSAYLFGRITDSVAPRLATTFAEIRAVAPNAQVFVVGYPQVAPNNATDACFTDPLTANSVPYNGVDLQFLHDIEQQLDDTIEAAATAANFTFIPTWDQTAGNTLCTPDPWINGITLYLNSGSTCDPDYLPADGNTDICVKIGALHPDEGGVLEIANIVQGSIADWAATRGITASASDVTQGGQVVLSGGGFGPNETVQIELHSTPVVLASIPASATGTFSTTLTIPTGTAPGSHTLVARGLSSDREFSTPITVTASGSSSGGGASVLAEGGMDASALQLVGLTALLGTTLLAGGAVLVLRRRQTGTSQSATARR
ncbi:SGNH/GDSL hydrolase family protein [Microbacterium schleiferi]|uniref:SGNH/GDSL hydrolase family protein n=1 Tax=Microbacterium schleiferi TaxID=69362 RepID=A0ABU7V4S1_9MICO